MANSKNKSRYKIQNDRALIEIRLRASRQLFDNLDPSPYVERDLSADTQEYLVESVAELSSKQPIAIVIHLAQEEPDGLSPEGIRSAIHSHFEYQAEGAQRRIRNLIRRGRVALLVGLVLLTLFLTAGHLLNVNFQGLTSRVLAEGLVIVGWVAIWRPIELILYDWWPLLDQRRIFLELSRCPVDVIYEQS